MTKEVSKQWVSLGGKVPKQVKTISSAGKVTANVIWGPHDIIFIDFRKRKIKNQHMYHQYYWTAYYYKTYVLLQVFVNVCPFLTA